MDSEPLVDARQDPPKRRRGSGEGRLPAGRAAARHDELRAITERYWSLDLPELPPSDAVDALLYDDDGLPR